MSSIKPHTICTVYSDGKYSGWPTIARSAESGRIFIVFSGDRYWHICPYGKVMMITSDDDGVSWSQAKVIYDGPLDDRDAGVFVTSKGTVLVNWFNSLAYRSVIEHNWDGYEDFDKAELARWQEKYQTISDECVSDELGCWMVRSEDNGETFSHKIPSIANSPHGPTELSDGRLIYIGKLRDEITGFADSNQGAPHSDKIGVSESVDDGKTWQLLCSELPVAEGQTSKEYHEFHAVEASDGKVIAQIRNHNKGDGVSSTTWQMESSDGGRSWSVPHSIGVLGLPSHLIKLASGDLLMSYSHRFEPLGNFARISRDSGDSWSQPFVFGPAQHADMGYPSSTQLPDGNILSVWYEWCLPEKTSVLRLAKWSLPA